MDEVPVADRRRRRAEQHTRKGPCDPNVLPLMHFQFRPECMSQQHFFKQGAPFAPPCSRRSLVLAGALSAVGLTLVQFLALFRRAEGRDDTAAGGVSPAGVAARARRCILIWLDGGPSHLDTFDPKPEAPAEIRGPFAAIPTSVPGVALCELMPECAQRMERLVLLRSLTSNLGEHNLGAHYVLTGYRPTPVLTYPAWGAVVAYVHGAAGSLPAYVSLPGINSQAGPGFLPPRYGAFVVESDPARSDFRVQDLDLFPGVTAERLARRRNAARQLELASKDVREATRRASSEKRSGGDTWAFEQAYDLLTMPAARQAFDLSEEPAEVRARYGDRTVGQACLLARRLVEAGVPFVTVHDAGWDTHDRAVLRLKEGYSGGLVGKIPSLDRALAALLDELTERGLLEETLVVVLGEFGRTPRVNVQGGRDHWPRVFSAVLAGGGLQGGRVIGASDERGESPLEQPVRPEDLAHTVYKLLGIDPALELTTPQGRSIRLSAGEAIAGLV
jgi:hypothetical protein